MTDSFWHNADSAKENASLNLQQISITLQTSYKKNENPSNQLVDSLEEIAEINQKNAGCLITNKEAITLLSNLLETTRDETTRWQVADRLGIYEELLDLLINAKADNIRYQAALSLVKLGTNNPLVIDFLVQLCQNAQNESVRCQAALSLVKLGINNPLVIDCLVQLCQNAQNESVRCQSAARISTGNFITSS
jgi:HEAT repeat protein